jgi:hypothetical protein
MGLGIILLKEIIQLTEMGWVGHIVRMANERDPRTAWQAKTQGKMPK